MCVHVVNVCMCCACCFTQEHDVSPRLIRIFSIHSRSYKHSLPASSACLMCCSSQKPFVVVVVVVVVSGIVPLGFANIKHTHTQSATQHTHHTHTHTPDINLVNDPSATHTLVCLPACLSTPTISSSLALTCTHYKLLILSLHCTDSSAKTKKKR